MLQVVRQDEPMLITAINELARGFMSSTSEAFIRSLSGELAVPPKDKRVLFATNDSVDIYNMEKVSEMDGRLYTYTSKDAGLKSDLSRLHVPKVTRIEQNMIFSTCT